MSKDRKPSTAAPQADRQAALRVFPQGRDRRARDNYLSNAAWTVPFGARVDDLPILPSLFGAPAAPALPPVSGAPRASRSVSSRALAQFLERSPAAVAIVDADMNELLVSDHWRALRTDIAAATDKSAGSLIGGTPEREERLRLSVDGGVASTFVEKMTTVRGPRWIRWRQAPWRHPDGSLAGAFVQAEDVTKDIARHSALQEENDALRAANQELRNLHFAFAERLSEPLEEMDRLTGGRRASAADGALAASCLALLRDRVAAMRDTVQSMVRFTDMASMQIAPVPTPLGAVIEEAMSDLRDAILKSRALVWVGPAPVVNGDRALLVELFRRLIDNALRHAGEAPTIRIDWLDSDRDGVVVRVTDDGGGVPAPLRRRAFDFFERLDDGGTGRSGVQPGVGMGLAACRKIMDLHRGVIALDPDWDAGTRVVMTFPFPSGEPTPH